MESIIERISNGHFWDFHGGIHPPEQKVLTSGKPIKQLALPKQLIIPLQQHKGLEGDLLVSIGDHVLKGQALTQCSNPMEVPVHAPTSGTISAIKQSVIAHPSGLSQRCVFLDVDGLDTWRKREVCSDLSLLTNHQIIEKIADAGISGMGGAGFPTHIKVSSKPDINFLIINGAECEPYITADDLLMMEQSNAIVDGIHILDRLLAPAFILIAIEDNKPKSIKALQQATKNIEKIKVCVVPTKYPTGGEKQLIQILTGQEVASGKLPIQSGVVMQNVATCFAINEAVRHDTPLIRRVVTVTGQALNKPQNVWALLGTPINFLLEQCDAEVINGQKQPVIMGGPLMGFSVSNDNVPIVKTSNCILVPNKKEMPSSFEKVSKEVECIRCGQCSDVCPSQLLPQDLQWSAKAKDHPQLKRLNLSDCIECGACAYVCPSQIPLVHYYRIAKAEIREQHQLDLKAEKAKIRFEARKVRLEKEKIARQEKHKKAAAARKAAMNKGTPEATGAKSAVAAALARVKAKKAQQAGIKDDSQNGNQVNSKTEVNAATDKKPQVAAAIARAKAKKLAKEQAANSAVNDATAVDEIADTKIAISSTKKPIKNDETIANNADTKKAKIAAAIAKAKAKKAGKVVKEPVKLDESTTANKKKADSNNTSGNDLDGNINKDSVPVSKASPKKQSKPLDSKEQQSETVKKSSPVSDKKAKIAAAIAKAKAKKQQKDASAIEAKHIETQQKNTPNNEKSGG